MSVLTYKSGKMRWWLWAAAGDVLLALGLRFWRQLVYASKILAPQCMLQSTTGLCCPTCGGTRAVVSLLHGDFFAAMRYNWFVMALLGYAAVVWTAFHLFCIFGGHRTSKLLRWLTHYRVIIFLGVLAGCFFILTNIPILC